MANSLKAIFEEGREMVRTGRAQNARQCPYHHREQMECWRAGFHLAMEELSAKVKTDKKAEAEAPPPPKHVGPPAVEEPKPKKSGKKKAKK